MVARRPFGSRAALLTAASDEWHTLGPDDWREAFGHHPKIGDRDAQRTRFAMTRDLSEKEQAGIKGASDVVLHALADGNRAYEDKFGYIFIVCATGKNAEDMLALLQERLGNNPETEIHIAAEEHANITVIRLLNLP